MSNREFKLTGKLKDKTIVFTFIEDNFNYLVALAKFYGVSLDSEEFGKIVLSAARDGFAKSVSLTSKTRDEIIASDAAHGFTTRQVTPEEIEDGL